MRTIILLIFPGFQILDAAGPIAAFEIAGRLCPGSYALQLAAVAPGAVPSSAGVSLSAAATRGLRAVDTLLIAGGEGVDAAAACATTRRFVLRMAESARRVASVCSGAYVLARAGLLDGRRATTHWRRTPEFARRFPAVRLEPDRIFLRDGKFWTSAGISAGIDLALALIEQDLGESVARSTAQQLVVYHRRPGGQSQFSALLDMARPVQRFGGLLDYVRGHLRERLSVDDLAQRSHLSARQFSRLFHAEVGMPPARAVEALRVEAARTALESGAASIQRVALDCGFGHAERMRRSFLRITGMPPAAVKRRVTRRDHRGSLT